MQCNNVTCVSPENRRHRHVARVGKVKGKIGKLRDDNHLENVD